jgi:hypothetical protein
MFYGSGKGVKWFSPFEFRSGTGTITKRVRLGLASKTGVYGQAGQAPYIKESGREGIFKGQTIKNVGLIKG